MTGYQIVFGGAITLSPQAQGTVTATCPGSKMATGGGYTTMNEAGNVYDSAPTASGNGWTTSAKNENLVGSGVTLTPIAICVDPPGGLQQISGGVTMRHQEIKTAEARCLDATYRVVGGGVKTGDPVVHAFASTPGSSAQPNWLASFKSNYSIALPSSSSGTAVIICASLAQVPGQTIVSSPVTTVGLSSKATLNVSCPAGTVALSGGVSSAESPGIWFDSSPLTGGTGWTASSQSSDPARPGDGERYALRDMRQRGGVRPVSDHPVQDACRPAGWLAARARP